MRTLTRTFLISLFGLWLTQNFDGGFKIVGDWQIYLASAAVLTFIYIFIRPLLRLFFLPINFLSLGLLSWLINVAILYLLTLIVPQVQISDWQFAGFSYQGFVIPHYHFGQIANFILVSFILSFVINFLSWLSR